MTFGMIFIQHSWNPSYVGGSKGKGDQLWCTNKKSTTEEFLVWELKLESPEESSTKGPNIEQNCGSTAEVVNQGNKFLGIIEPTETEKFVSTGTQDTHVFGHGGRRLCKHIWKV
jgi:hypothetical protein